jgi:N-acetyl-gamma-glutamylphosphate reductase
MTFRNSMLITAAALIAAPAAFAQTSQTSPAPATTPGTAPAQGATGGTSGAGTAATATVTDTEVTQFATAALAVAKLRQDATVPDADKNAKMVEAITATGLAAPRFNEIAQAMQADQALNKRIQDAAAKQQPAAAAPAQR